MNTDRLYKLLGAWLPADRNAVKDGGEERAKHEGEIRALIGGVEAAPDPWPDAVRSASKIPDMDAAWRFWRLPCACPWCALPANGAINRTPPRDMARSCTVPRCGPVVG